MVFTRFARHLNHDTPKVAVVSSSARTLILCQVWLLPEQIRYVMNVSRTGGRRRVGKQVRSSQLRQAVSTSNWTWSSRLGSR